MVLLALEKSVFLHHFLAQSREAQLLRLEHVAATTDLQYVATSQCSFPWRRMAAFILWLLLLFRFNTSTYKELSKVLLYAFDMIRRENLRFFLSFVLFCVLAGAPTAADVINSCDDDSTDKDDSETCSNTRHDESATTDDTMVEEQWKWIPEAQHRCNIVRMTHDNVLREFGPLGVPPLHPEPLVILGDKKRNRRFRELTSRENITSSLPIDMNVTLSSSNSFSAHRRTIPLTQYLDEIQQNDAITTPDQLSNETWYLFGETYSEEWKSLLQTYELPPCHTCQSDVVALSFGIGNRGSGVQWHVHGPGFSEALHGRKHWVLYPQKPLFNPDYTSRHWMEYTYSTLLMEDELPFECTLEPGDAIYFPDDWYHATINLDPYTAFVSTFTIEHL